MDWHDWHEAYDEPGSELGRRLVVVRERIGEALDEAPAGPVRVVSACAGQGRDLLPVLRGHPRRNDVVARLVELDPRNAEVVRRAAVEAGLRGVDVVTGDAAATRHYVDLAPARLVLMCGVFGNITDSHIRRVLDHCTALCATGGTLIWTRHRRPPDLVPDICGWLAERGFEQRWLPEPDAGFGVGVHRFTGEPAALPADASMFTFRGYRALRGTG
ncbi:class I SAM-dependent methyltransferase [Streptomyces sp. NPDC127098]|uniref:class I SAM-dependent methyltransferase n=1 Tax=Streptomyces sp. NPDC127098 TaxID=3347137 RepID=UPI0036540EB4